MAKRKPERKLKHKFLENCTTPGRYSDGRGSGGLVAVAEKLKDGSLSMRWTQRVTVKNGPVRNMGLGKFPEVSLKEARDEADARYQMAREGIDPLAPDDEAPGDDEAPDDEMPIFSEFAESVFEKDRAGDLSKDRKARLRHYLDKYILPELGGRKVDTITRADVYDVMVTAQENMPASAHDVLGYIRKIFARVVMEVDDIEVSPVDAVLKAALPANTHVVKHYDSVPYHLVGQAISKIRAAPRTGILIRLCMIYVILTGCRHGEARQMTWSELRWRKIEFSENWNVRDWDEVDWDELRRGSDKVVVWMVPGDNTKMKKAHRVPLSAGALEVLMEARELRDPQGSEPVFRSKRTKSGQMAGSALVRLCRRLGLGGTPHGFRSSFRSWCADHKVPFDVAEIALSHELTGVVQAYLRTDLLELRAELMEPWHQYLTGTLPKDWKWTVGNEELIEQIQALTRLLEELRAELGDLRAMLRATLTRAETAEARVAELEAELQELRNPSDMEQLVMEF